MLVSDDACMVAQRGGCEDVASSVILQAVFHNMAQAVYFLTPLHSIHLNVH